MQLNKVRYILNSMIGFLGYSILFILIDVTFLKFINNIDFNNNKLSLLDYQQVKCLNVNLKNANNSRRFGKINKILYSKDNFDCEQAPLRNFPVDYRVQQLSMALLTPLLQTKLLTINQY